MKKSLLLTALAATALAAQADKVAFVANDARDFYDGDAKTIIYIPNGYFLNQANEFAPTKSIAKTLSSDFVEISAADAGDFGFAKASVLCKCYVTSGSFRWYTNQALKFAPAAGITLKSIKVRTQRYDPTMNTDKVTVKTPNYVFPFTKNTADTEIYYSNTEDKTKAEVITLSAQLNTAEPVYLQPTGQIRAYYLELEYEGTLTQTKVPVCSANLPYVFADQDITLTAEEGAKIHYTLDGTEPTADSPVYTAPFKLTEDAVVRAIAIKDGSTSFPFYAEYFVVPAGLDVATFNYSQYKTLTWKDGSKIQESDWSLDAEALPCNCRINLDGKSFTANGVDVTFTKGAKDITLFRSWTFGNIVEVRPNGDTACTQTYSVPEGKTIEHMIVVGSSIAEKANVIPMAAAEGTFTLSPTNFFNAKWVGNSQNVTLKSGTYVDQVYVFYKGDGTGAVSDIDNANAPVEYFNLQGVKVANPEAGVFIRRQGTNITKVVK